MPGKVKVKIVAGRNLPVMDRSSDTTDAYVEIKLGSCTYKTDVCRKSLNPQWNSEWYRFEVDDHDLQDEPLQIRLMDYDVYSANDSIGKVYIDLNPLLLPIRHYQFSGSAGNPTSTANVLDTGAFSNSSSSSASTAAVLPGSVFSGWVPVYDTMNGMRGEVNITVKVELFNDFNKFRQSSCGVHFFYSPIIPFGYHAKVIHGFVEELVVNDDPEYHWIDKIRTPRASNEARQTLFFKLSGEVQRKIGLKALEVGANSVIGYQQSFDFEGDAGIVVRGIGTACTLVRIQDSQESKMTGEETGATSVHGSSGHCRTESVGNKINAAISSIHRRSSDSDLSITPKGNSLSNAERPTVVTSCRPIAAHVKQSPWDILEFPFLTMTKFPAGFIRYFGGTVSSRSVKLLAGVERAGGEEPEKRDVWWTELRMEVRSHARSLGCNVVIGYTEQTCICDDVCVLSAFGTAAIVDMQKLKGPDEEDIEPPTTCNICHVPYSESSVPYRISMSWCAVCRKSRVADVLIATVEIPAECPTVGSGSLIQAQICRPKRELRSELNAREISEMMPFVEYDLYRLLINKLKVKGMNAIFGLNVRHSVGERMLVATAFGTAVYLLPLPAPVLPKLAAGTSNMDNEKLREMQKRLDDMLTTNRNYFKISGVDELLTQTQAPVTDEVLDEFAVMDLNAGNKEPCVLEIDDTEHVDILSLLIASPPPSGFHAITVERPPGVLDVEFGSQIQLVTQLIRFKLPSDHQSVWLGRQFHQLLQSFYFKLRRMAPAAFCKLRFHLDLPEGDEIQLTAFATVISTQPARSRSLKERRKWKKGHCDDEIFTLEEDDEQESPPAAATAKSPQARSELQFFQRGIDITSLSYVSGGHIVQYLGNINFFFIRESTSVREGSGLSGFVHCFITDVLSIVRAHICALGGNAMVSFFMNQCVLFKNPHKNQGQCLVNVGGDVVFVSYYQNN